MPAQRLMRDFSPPFSDNKRQPKKTHTHTQNHLRVFFDVCCLLLLLKKKM